MNLMLQREFGLLLVISGAPMLLLGLAIPYAILKIRDARSEEGDPEIGIKSALYYGFSLGILIALAGSSFLVFEFFETRSSSSAKMAENTRTGLALLATGVPTAVTHVVLLLGLTNDRRYPEVRRVFVGWRLAIHSLVVLVGYAAFMLTIFHKDRGDIELSDLQLPMSLLFVWLPSWLIHLILLRVYQRPVMPRLRMVPPTIRSREESAD